MAEDIREAALRYHREGRPGKIEVIASKPLGNQRDLSRALQVEGEMHADAAIDPDIRERIFPSSVLEGQANLLVMPDQDAANIAFNLLKTLADGLAVGPILVGAERSAHLLTPSVTARGILNMSAVAVVGAQYDARAKG